MPVVRWEPWNLADQLLRWPPSFPALLGFEEGVTGMGGLDIYETDNQIVVKAPVPGVSPEEVNVVFENGVLRIQARHEETEEEKKAQKNIYRKQRLTSFDYTTTLPRPVEADKITAEVSEGVVTVNAPISEAAQPKKIPVKTA